MVRYTVSEIQSLCQRLENRAASLLADIPDQAADLRNAARLLRMVVQLTEIDAVEFKGC